MIKYRKTIVATPIVLVMIAGMLLYAHHDFYRIPDDRIGLEDVYPEMPADSFHHYLNFPVDHNRTSAGSFRGFYQLSPDFYQHDNITFLLTDGQMELVSTDTDFEFFENILGGSYVLMGVRGHSPTLFPEVYKDGKVDYKMATQIFDSDQQVEDIELVRQDLIKKNILTKEGKINVFGASGAGVLAQQYISKYGQHVNRVILESTGAPDLSIQYGLRYSPDFKDYNPKGAEMLNTLTFRNADDKQAVCNILYQAGRTARSPREAQVKIIEELKNGKSLFSYKLKPVTNLTVLNYMIKSPREIAARVRWFELVGYDLLQYNSKDETNLLYEFSAAAVSDMAEYYRSNNIHPKQFVINRSGFTGEVLIIKGTEDVVFSDEISRKIQRAYTNSKVLFFKDGHRMQNDVGTYRKIRNAFFDEGFDSEKFNVLTSASQE